MSNSYIGILRTRATESEQVFYNLVKDLGLHCLFQMLFKRKNKGHYYVDFRFKLTRHQLQVLRGLGYPVKPSKCVKHRILVEIDGEYHNQQQAYDFQREQEILNNSGSVKYHFIRFTNNQVLFNSSEVIKKFYSLCKQLWGIELQFRTVQNVLLDNQIGPIKQYNFIS